MSSKQEKWRKIILHNFVENPWFSLSMCEKKLKIGK